jgi:hypothetical protein
MGIGQRILTFLENFYMTTEDAEQSEQEQLHTENELLKLKLMLETGAEMGANGNLPADIENAFLKQVLAFEQQHRQKKSTTVFDKLGKPNHFAPAGQIPDTHMAQAWLELKDFMSEKGIELDAISTKVTPRELYRFTVEELFDHEMDDMDIPGMMQAFIYDEFYPDYEYDNSKHAINDCINLIFNPRPENYWTWMAKQVSVNGAPPILREDFGALVKNFKTKHTHLKLQHATVSNCKIVENECVVTGTYSASARPVGQKLTQNWAGNWRILFYFGSYDMTELTLDDFDFGR